jgi:hypothetical protein
MTDVLTPPRAFETGERYEPHPELTVPVAAAPAGAPWRLLLSVAFLACLAVFLTGRIAAVPNLSLAGALGALVFGVGTAPLAFSRTASLSARLTVGALIGLSTAFLVGALLVLEPLWYPDVAAAVVVAAAATVHAIALPGAVAELRDWKPGITAQSLLGAVMRPTLLCTLAGTGLWLSSAIATGHVVPGIGGLLGKITPLWYAGVVLVLAGVVLARREPEPYAALGVLSLVLALTLTPALIYGMPRSQSAGKHIEIVQLILHTHRLHASQGIYSAYSAFFAGVAWLCRTAHVGDSTGIATFWPMVMGLIRIPALAYLFGQVIDDRYRRWVAITLVVLVDAIGADYFSPQAAGYALGLCVFGLAIGRWSGIESRLKWPLIVTAGCALAISHELSPYVVGGVLIVLGVFRLAHPRWAGIGILAPAGLWALINHNVLKGYFSLSALGNISNFKPPALAARPGLSRDPIVGQSSHALLLGMVVLSLGALAAVARHRRQRWAWAYLICAGVGLAFVALNPYGNEGIFRASLFGIPWLALLAVFAVQRTPRARGSLAWMLLTVGLLGTFVLAAFGMDGSNVMRRADLSALRTFNATAPPGSYLLDLGFSDLPSSPPTLESVNHLVAFISVADRAAQLPGHPTRNDLSNVLFNYNKLAWKKTGSHSGALYAVWSPVSAIYAKEYGLELPSQAYKWRDLLLSSPDWQVVRKFGGSYLFRATVAVSKPVGGLP